MLLLAQSTAFAHNRGTSYSYWTITKSGEGAQAEVRARVSQLELTRLQLDPAYTVNYAEAVQSRLTDEVQLWSSAGPCKPSGARLVEIRDGWLTAGWKLDCASAGGLTIRSRLLHQVAPSHLHFVRVESQKGSVSERVLTYAEPALKLEDPAPVLTHSLKRYLELGVEHILTGWDHMAFVLALILLAASLREVAIVATGFTIAHSLTLALAVLGLVQTRGEVVEALIGFSIALVAMENLWLRGGRERWVPYVLVLSLLFLAAFGFTRLPFIVLLGLAMFSACHFGLLAQADRPARLRLALAFIFGLVHGFGFAGIMAELQLPSDKLAVALLGFNTGVEFGQLLVIAVAWPLLMLLRRWSKVQRWVYDGGSALICGLGTYWFVIRSFG